MLAALWCLLFQEAFIMATSSWARRPRVGAALSALGFAAFFAGVPAGAQTLQVGFSQSLRGGVGLRRDERRVELVAL